MGLSGRRCLPVLILPYDPVPGKLDCTSESELSWDRGVLAAKPRIPAPTCGAYGRIRSHSQIDRIDSAVAISTPEAAVRRAAP
ncbi:hypothetical protein SAMN04488012_111111 [Palleronia salina]|uniref:Uncharacterized protein n=1 Tax=Palleronia salina TaxID=313368 RepID=A0A1M6KC38_9RHOB|nr:hypothetical protein SAMN04488012_111111 [Palleronia salina]